MDLASSMPNSSFLLLQQHAAAHQQQQQQQGTNSDGSSVATLTETTTKTTAISIMAGGTHHHHSHGAQSIQRASTAAASAAVINCCPPTVDHCNRPEGFHDGLSDLANDTEEDFVVDSSELEKLEHCASQSRMPPDALTEDEKAAFPDIANDRLHVYLHIRNSILRIWYHNPRVRAFEHFVSSISKTTLLPNRNNYFWRTLFSTWRHEVTLPFSVAFTLSSNVTRTSTLASFRSATRSIQARASDPR